MSVVCLWECSLVSGYQYSGGTYASVFRVENGWNFHWKPGSCCFCSLRNVSTQIEHCAVSQPTEHSKGRYQIHTSYGLLVLSLCFSWFYSGRTREYRDTIFEVLNIAPFSKFARISFFISFPFPSVFLLIIPLFCFFHFLLASPLFLSSISLFI